ncbi:exon0 [Parapoynx stagnalis nucleopolyhedrovirus]|uniref:Exon0 n=1 Tax=Parapoynx stagnalis nucleopolyhedrovirus TaxID=2993413 RepID=A0A9E7YA94_9ABAC|nr:exon0 [Parapoynx stagnalis nucleopolyhedrovirus]
MTSNKDSFVLNYLSTQQYMSQTEVRMCNDGDISCYAPVQKTDQVMLSTFIFSHMYTPDLKVDLKAQANIRMLAFNMIDDKHVELFEKKIIKFFVYFDTNISSDAAAIYKQIPNDTCCHQYVSDANNIVMCIKKLERSFEQDDKQSNILIFFPYLKQLRDTVDVLKNEFKCCKVILNDLQAYITNLIAHCLLFVEKFENLYKTFKVINVFLDNSVVYECNICRETSTDNRFLKVKECCEFAICNACCVQLWKNTNTRAKCPACKTSFK